MTGTWWKILRFPLTRIVIAIIFFALPRILVGNGLGAIRRWLSLGTSLPFDILTYTIDGLAVYFSYRFYVRLVERREATELALQGAAREAALGGALGVVLFTATVAVLWLSNSYHVAGFNSAMILIPVLASALSTGFTEELVFRGIIFRITEEGLGTWIAFAVSALLFGFVHLNNPNASITSAIAIALEAGLLLGAAYILTRRLWLAMGLHASWNFTQGGIFGVTVSGTESHGLFQGSLEGPEWLSGGEFGAEASAVAVIVCLIAFVALMRIARQKGQLLKPAWRRLAPAGKSLAP